MMQGRVFINKPMNFQVGFILCLMPQDVRDFTTMAAGAYDNHSLHELFELGRCKDRPSVADIGYPSKAGASQRWSVCTIMQR